MPYAKTAFGDLFYTLSPGPQGASTLVLVHGAGGTRLHWPAELRRLPEATVYTLDLPSHGRSLGKGCDTIAAYADSVAAFSHAVGIKQAVIVGHSMGSAIAMTMALDFADHVAGLVLIATGARLRVAPTILEGIRIGGAIATDQTGTPGTPGNGPRCAPGRFYGLRPVRRDRATERGRDAYIGDRGLSRPAHAGHVRTFRGRAHL
jgi:pimeloyl-ACP methyl ester carboxylesterase